MDGQGVFPAHNNNLHSGVPPLTLGITKSSYSTCAYVRSVRVIRYNVSPLMNRYIARDGKMPTSIVVLLKL